MNQKGTAGKFIKYLALALAAGLAVTIFCAMLTAVLISGERVGENAEGIGAAVSLFAGGIIAALTAAGLENKNRVGLCFAGGGIYFLGLLCCAALIFDGVRGGVVMTLLVVMGASLCGILLGMKGQRKVKYKLPKSHR